MNYQYSNPQYSTHPSAYQNTFPQYGNTFQTPTNTYSQQQQQQPTWRAGPAPSYTTPYADEPAPKRARVDATPSSLPPAQQNANATRWTPHYGNPTQPGGLAWPPIPVSGAQAATPTQPQPQSRQGGRVQEVQPGRNNEEVSVQLEHQVRSLADHDHSSTTPSQANQNTASGSAHHWRARRDLNLNEYYEANHEETPSVRPFQVQRQLGAKVGNALNLACQACTRKKMKCSRNFPCTECTGSNEECKSSTRKRKGPQQDKDRPEQDAASSRDQPSGKGYKVDNPNRKFMLNLPVVIGTHQHWNNKTLKYNPIPSDIDAFREKIFKLEKPMLITSQQYADYWPHISNVYGRSINVVTEANGTSTEVWECRNQRRQSKHRREHVTQGEGKRQRRKKNHLLESEEPCKLRFRIVYYLKHNLDIEDDHLGLGNCKCVPEWLHLERTQGCKPPPTVEHNHSLESMDRFKRSDAMLFLAREKVAEGGYMYAAVFRWLKKKYGGVTKQLEFLTDSDIANASRVWRLKNREVELAEEIAEAIPEEEERRRCMDMLNTTSPSGLKQALAEIFRQIPVAAAIALSHLQAAQEIVSVDCESSEVGGVLEGDDIVIPEPGLPERLLPKKHDPPIIVHEAASGIQWTPTATSVQRTPGSGPLPTPPPGYRLQVSHVPASGELEQGYSFPTFAKPYSSKQKAETPQKRGPGRPPKQPPKGGNKLTLGQVLRAQGPPKGNRPPVYVTGQAPMAPSGTVAQAMYAEVLQPRTIAEEVEAQRPSWARPEPGKGKRTGKEAESDEQRVAKQLEAELQASTSSGTWAGKVFAAAATAPATPAVSTTLVAANSAVGVIAASKDSTPDSSVDPKQREQAAQYLAAKQLAEREATRSPDNAHGGGKERTLPGVRNFRIAKAK